MSTSPTQSERPPRPILGKIAGELFVTAGVILMLFVVYELYWTNIAAARLQKQATAELEEKWTAEPTEGVGTEPVPPAVPAHGEAFARIHLPKLGADVQYTVVEGTNNDDLRTGPGHYEDTQMPGARGNAALAGHRNGSGAVFQYIDRLGPCDAVVIETETQWMTYRVLPVATDPAQRQAEAEACLTPEVATRLAYGDYSQVPGQHITTPDAVEVLSPIPGQDWAPASAEPDGAKGEEMYDANTVAAPSGAEPAGSETAAAPVPLESLERLLTLTTCHPQFSNAERLIVHAVLAETISKAGGQLPAALKE